MGRESVAAAASGFLRTVVLFSDGTQKKPLYVCTDSVTLVTKDPTDDTTTTPLPAATTQALLCKTQFTVDVRQEYWIPLVRGMRFVQVIHQGALTIHLDPRGDMILPHMATVSNSILITTKEGAGARKVGFAPSFVPNR